MVTRIVVRQQKVEPQVSRQALLEFLLPVERCEEINGLGSVSDDLIIFEADAQLKRCGGEIRLLLSDADQSRSRPVPSLVRAVARANDWVDRIFAR